MLSSLGRVESEGPRDTYWRTFQREEMGKGLDWQHTFGNQQKNRRWGHPSGAPGWWQNTGDTGIEVAEIGWGAHKGGKDDT